MLAHVFPFVVVILLGTAFLEYRAGRLSNALLNVGVASLGAVAYSLVFSLLGMVLVVAAMIVRYRESKR